VRTIESVTGIIIQNRAVLMVRPQGKDYFISPGGKPIPGEERKATLCRELGEELSITVFPENIALFGIYHAPAKGQPGKQVELYTYLVNDYSGEISPNNEIEELGWFNTANPEPNAENSIFTPQVIPQLIKQGLVD
jgi:8-oxo-dGTP diphosphatase